ncbi:hypothetical protein M501DRAFT_985231 [Patellaria atrata CBS 101060]|uniref:Xylanolytic transcriptional activator regulatory domain-containing protein n=1 Tax=Patellaria atrata CBS 101060 TaxID=1346257 RepID=A0A9P4VVJ0_9PEZI|nr:hypothetical protein M501DRAFT_985231 [Patellaria atrata CBS 101060]
MSTMITFAANNDFFRKRKRVHRACEPCKRKRKRCSHTFDDDVSTDPTSSTVLDPTSQTKDNVHVLPETAGRNHTSSRQETTRYTPTRPIEKGRPTLRASTPPRFVGYLSPEAALRSQLRDNEGTKSDNTCGMWVTDDRKSSTKATRRAGPRSELSIRKAPERSNACQLALNAYLEAVGAYLLPPRKHLDALLDIFFSFVQPILPIVDQQEVQSQYADGRQSRLLMQTICIVACKHDKARIHLILSNDEVLPPRDFAKTLYAATIASIEAKLESDRIILIQVFALLALHCEGFDGAEQASMHLAQAIHHAHTIGLQFGPNGKHRHDDSLEDLYWCLWTLDRVNGTINSRPLMIHDQDASLNLSNAISKHKGTAFGIWLQLSQAMDKVVSYYRPGVDNASTTGWEDNFPSFEDMILDERGESVEERLGGPILAGLYLFYHAVSMASHMSKSVNDPIRETASYTRQSLSAVQVISILKTDCPENLPPLPIVPYALSLAMAVVYRQFRQRKLQMHRLRAKEEMKTCCTLLNKLRTAWWSAGAMEDLGRAALQKANRADSRDRRSTSVVPSVQQVASISSIIATTKARVPAHGYPTPTDNSLNPHLEIASNGSLSNTLTFDINGNITGQPAANNPSPDGTGSNGLGLSDSSDWLNFDYAFDNMDTLLGSAGADLSNEILNPFSYNTMDFTPGAT